MSRGAGNEEVEEDTAVLIPFGALLDLVRRFVDAVNVLPRVQ